MASNTYDQPAVGSNEHDYWLLSPPDEIIFQQCNFATAYEIYTLKDITALVNVVIHCITAAGKRPPGVRELTLLRRDLDDRFPAILKGLSKQCGLAQYTVGDRDGQMAGELIRAVDLMSEAAFVAITQETQPLHDNCVNYGQSLANPELMNISYSSNSSFGSSTEDEMQTCTSITSITDDCAANIIHIPEPSINETPSKDKRCKNTCTPKLFRCDYCGTEYSKKSELTRHWTQSVKGCPRIPRQPKNSCKCCGTNHDRIKAEPKVEWLPQCWKRKVPDHSGNREGDTAHSYFLGSLRAKETDQWETRHFQFDEDPRKRG